MENIYEIIIGALSNSPLAIVLLVIYFDAQKRNRQTVDAILLSHRQQIKEIVNGQHADVTQLVKGSDKMETALRDNTSQLNKLHTEIVRHTGVQH